MKVIYNITKNKFNASLNQETTEIKVSFKTGYYPLPVGLENYYTKNETNLLLENYYLKTETYSQTEVNNLLNNKQNNLGYTPENVANKSDSYTVSSSTTYASSKALVDGLATKLDKGTGTSNSLVKFLLDGTVGDSSIFDSGTNVGIGLIPISERLEIYGNVLASGFKKTGGTAKQALTANGGVFDLTTKADLVDGKVPSSQLPSYVDDVLEFANLASFPATGESGKIYIAIDTNVTYRWTGTGYAEISASLALGETYSTAYRGDRGKIAYDHSQTIGNPHGTTKSDIGLGNVNNTSDLDKPISTATQNALNTKVDLAVFDNLQIGGRNLLLNSKKWNVGNWWSYNGGQQIPQGDLGIALTKHGVTIIENKAATGSMSTNMIPGEQYTISFDYFGTTPFEISVGARANKTFNPVADNGRITFTFTYQSDFNGYFYISNILEGSSVTVKNLKLEKGNKGTDWTPAPEDKQDRLQDVTGNIGVGKTDASATEKLDVNGNVKATQIKDQYGSLKSQRVITITGNTTLSEIHNGAILHVTNTCTITIPTGLDVNFQCVIFAKGSIIVLFIMEWGVTVYAPSGLLLKTDKMASLICTSANNFNLTGELATS